MGLQRPLPSADEHIMPANDHLRCFGVVIPATGAFSTRVSTIAELQLVDREVRLFVCVITALINLYE